MLDGKQKEAATSSLLFPRRHCRSQSGDQGKSPESDVSREVDSHSRGIPDTTRIGELPGRYTSPEAVVCCPPNRTVRISPDPTHAGRRIRFPPRFPQNASKVGGRLTVVGLILSVAAAGSAAIDLEGVVGFRVSSSPNAKASVHVTANLCGDGWSLDGSTSLGILPDVDSDSTLAFSVERGFMTLTSEASFAGTHPRCESLTVELSGFGLSLPLRKATPQIELVVSAGLGTVVTPAANPYATLVATLSVDEHRLRIDLSPAVSGSISLYGRGKGDGNAESDLQVWAVFSADLVSCRLSRVALDARVDLGHIVIMSTVGHSLAIPFSIGSSIRTVADALSLSVSASFVHGGAVPFRFRVRAEYEWRAFQQEPGRASSAGDSLSSGAAGTEADASRSRLSAYVSSTIIAAR